jgi:hypothetical protein
MMLEHQCIHWKCKPYLISISLAFMVIRPPIESTVMKVISTRDLLHPVQYLSIAELLHLAISNQMQNRNTEQFDCSTTGLIGRSIFNMAT